MSATLQFHQIILQFYYFFLHHFLKMNMQWQTMRITREPKRKEFSYYFSLFSSFCFKYKICNQRFEDLTSPKKTNYIAYLLHFLFKTSNQSQFWINIFWLFLPDLNNHLVGEVPQGRRLQNYDNPNEVDRISHNEQSQYHLLHQME